MLLEIGNAGLISQRYTHSAKGYQLMLMTKIHISYEMFWCIVSLYVLLIFTYFDEPKG